MRSQIEFWVATAEIDVDLHWSDIIWGDGYEASEALKIARSRVSEDVPTICEVYVHGPYLTNNAATMGGRDKHD